MRRALADGWLSLPFLVVGLIGTEMAASYQPETVSRPDGFAYALVVVAAFALALRRYPAVCVTVNGAVVAFYLAVGYPYGPILLTVPAAIYLLASRWTLRLSTVVTAAVFAVLIVATAVKRYREPGAFVGDTVWTALTWGLFAAAALAIGAAIRSRRESAAGVRAEQALRVASEERLRMAQDLHDSIGHGLAVIAMQAGVALHVLDRNPDQSRTAMEAVRATSRESLENLRAKLADIRSPDGAAFRRPASGLAELPRLVSRVRAGGVTLDVQVDDPMPTLPAEVDTAAYRILQESLTNVLRHAGACVARVRVSVLDGTLAILIFNEGEFGDSPKSDATAGSIHGSGINGSGINGMRALVDRLGGDVTAARVIAGTSVWGVGGAANVATANGFAVVARLPLAGGGR